MLRMIKVFEKKLMKIRGRSVIEMEKERKEERMKMRESRNKQ